MEWYILKDLNGRYFCADEDELFNTLLSSDFKILGLTLDNIADLKSQYEKRNGEYPMTSETITQAFK